MTWIVIMGGLACGFLYSVVLKGSNAGAYMDGFSTLAQMADLGLALAKGMVFGVVAAVIAAWRGLYAKGGAGGVGYAVNTGVVITILALVVVNLIMTFGYPAIVPDANQDRKSVVSGKGVSGRVEIG